MKKVLSLLLAISYVFVLAACGEKESKPANSVTPAATASATATETTGEAGFVKPENYSSVLLVTINPQIRLYLDADGIVLAVEAVNEDAETIKDSITFENESVETVMKKIVVTANEKGFIKSNATVSIELTESKETQVNKNDILDKAETTANKAAADLNIEIVVKAEDKTVTETPSGADNQTPSSSATSGETSAPQTAAPTTAEYTSVKAKEGAWFARYAGGDTLYDVNFYLCGSDGDLSVGAGLRWLVDGTLDADMLADAVEFDGKLYFGAAGDGDSLKSVAENGTSVIVTDNSGNTIEFTRESETTLKVKSVSAQFCVFETVPSVGTVFTFKIPHSHSYSAATCMNPRTCSCGATTGEALSHDYQSGVCSRCGIKTVVQKSGTWDFQYVSENTLYSVSLSLYGSASDLGVNLFIGDPLSSQPEEVQDEMRADCVEFNGVLYYIGRGDGDGLASVTETNTTVTVEDLSGNVLELTRTGEDSMTVKTSPAEFAVLGKISVGTVITFTAD